MQNLQSKQCQVAKRKLSNLYYETSEWEMRWYFCKHSLCSGQNKTEMAAGIWQTPIFWMMIQGYIYYEPGFHLT